MGVGERILNGLLSLIRLNDKMDHLGALVKAQQAQIETLTHRVVRLETILEMGFVRPSPPALPDRGID